ncbi:hypothetical protein [Pseudoalteromonas sp. MMG007]|uniref:hypothetical protein n=1 Tax=Pseudoalteromonas sp. MMG007 TaxID=2822684 RepID=UPI001B396E7E|nr:hypothetical protein [Pseudoalteromonas sp. MMG007]MBQ4858668.1 hypothetical protein [Pseudoalteromonas sp. MMG007]
MIFRDRASVAIPASCNGQGSEAELELQEAITYYQTYKVGQKSFSFKVYKNDDIKDALETLFEKKCAYCESEYSHIQPMEVEHYRPKGRIKKENITGYISPGYWWLAADWDNLLPSCIDCNRKRQHKTKNAQVTLGKADHFPLHPDSNDSRTEASLVNETPLLINPCNEDPSQKLIFANINDKPIAISLSKNGLSKLQVDSSIKYYGLNRPNLIEARAKTHKALLRSLMDIEEDLKLKETVVSQNIHRAAKDAILDPIENRLRGKLKYIKDNFLDTSNPYSLLSNKMFNYWVETLKSNVIQVVNK